jgi:hypothetical protein
MSNLIMSQFYFIAERPKAFHSAPSTNCILSFRESVAQFARKYKLVFEPKLIGGELESLSYNSEEAKVFGISNHIDRIP